MYVVRGCTVLELRVICVEVVVDVMRLDDVGQRRSVESEENWAKD